MPQEVTDLIANHTKLTLRQVAATLALLAEGASIPFISRYRKELTDGLDEVQIAAIQREHKLWQAFQKRKETVAKSLHEQGLHTAELDARLQAITGIDELEDFYLPYKPKRQTKASVARKLGLEPLAAILMKQDVGNVAALANRFVKGEVESLEHALEGARHIMAEWINERLSVRQALRRLFANEAVIRAKLVKGKEAEAEKYRDYFDFAEALKTIPAHRMLALRRAETEGYLKLQMAPADERALSILERILLKGSHETSSHVMRALQDAWKRLLKPSLENAFRSEGKAKADEEAIAVFAENLRQLLLAPPLGQKRILAVDPGFKSGCKLVCLDAQGQLLHNETIYPHPPQNEKQRAAAKMSQLLEAYKLEAIAIGNGTAGRETADFVRNSVFLRNGVEVYMVNEAGASVYSASGVARKEFANYDVTVRGTVSIGRRLIDPLAELVKIDPKSIGVGQYQHDVDQAKLKEALDQTVINVVNLVGVELNTAGEHLLAYVSGLGKGLASQIVAHRSAKGPFASRQALMEVKGMGAKAFEQAAGFLRIAGAENPLDNSAVHPESYRLVERMAADLKRPLLSLVGEHNLRELLELKQYCSATSGLPTINAVLEELVKAGRDPRGRASLFAFDPRLRKMEDLSEGMMVAGIVSNITNFGAFVDLGVKQDGLIHVSELADRFVKDPNEVVSLGQQVRVKVMSVDPGRKRIQLSLKQAVDQGAS